MANRNITKAIKDQNKAPVICFFVYFMSGNFGRISQNKKVDVKDTNNKFWIGDTSKMVAFSFKAVNSVEIAMIILPTKL